MDEVFSGSMAGETALSSSEPIAEAGTAWIITPQEEHTSCRHSRRQLGSHRSCNSQDVTATVRCREQLANNWRTTGDLKLVGDSVGWEWEKNSQGRQLWAGETGMQRTPRLTGLRRQRRQRRPRRQRRQTRQAAIAVVELLSKKWNARRTSDSSNHRSTYISM
jgi:hypothetical protein